jgi:hypothetical protein
MTLFNTFPFQSTDLRNPALGPAASDKTRYADPNHHLNPQPSLADFVPFSSQVRIYSLVYFESEKVKDAETFRMAHRNQL